MRHFAVPRLSWGFALSLLLSLTAAVHGAEIVTLADTDRDPATGCVLHGFPGIDAAITTRVAATATGMAVASHDLQLCSAGVLGPVVSLGGGWAVPYDGQQYSVEASIPYASLGMSRTTQARYGFVLLQDGLAPVRVPEDGVMLTLSPPSRRRSVRPAFGGPPSAADGNLAEWVPSEQIATSGGMVIWKSIEADALFLRFDVQPAAPIARDDDYAAPFGSTITVDAPGVLANDSAPQGQPLSAEIASPASHGSVTLSADGSFVYQHDGSTPATDAFTYRARDPFSASAEATVTLTPVVLSAPPVGTGDHYSTAEDQPLVVAAPGVLANDSDPDGDAITAQLDSAPSQGTVSLQSNGAFTYTPPANFYGTATFRYRVSDGSSLTEPITVTIVVDPVNDAPQFTAGANVTVLEDSTAYAAAWASAISAGAGEASQTVAFQITSNSNPALFSVAPAIAANGILTFAVAPNASGIASITVVLTDDGGTANGAVDVSVPASFTIAVDPVNDAPSFTLPSAAPAVDEDSGAQTAGGFAAAISAGPADESGQIVSFHVTQMSADPTLTFDVAPSIAADGTLTYTAAPNAYGTATFNVVLTDDGPGAPPHANTSATHPFTITVNAINDAPEFTIAAPPPASPEDGGAQTVSGFATALSQGANESGQTLAFTLAQTGATGSLAFSAGPAIDATTGALTYTAAPNAYGTATFNAVLADSGPGTPPHANTSSPHSFTITVNAVNDAPSFTLPATAPAADEDSGAQTVTGFAGAISAGPADETSQTLTFTVTQTSADATLAFSAAPSIAADGTLTYSAAPNAYGTATFSVVLNDDGAAAPPDANSSLPRTFTITVNAINDAPELTIATPPPASPEDGGAQTVSGFAGAISPGPNESGQTLAFVLSPAGATGTLAFSAGPSIDANTGALTYTAASNTSGTATFSAVLVDNGLGTPPHTNTSAQQTFTITVTAINDAPSFTLPASAPAVDEDSAAQTVAGFAGAVSAGPADESSQALTFNITQVSSDPTLTFSVAPSIAANGTLTYTAAANAYGSASFNVVLTDDGSATPPNANSSVTRTFSITVSPVNDPPAFTIAAPPPASPEDGGVRTVNGFATAISAGPNESGQTLAFVLSQTASSGTLAFSSAPSIDPATGALTYTATSNTHGTATFSAVLTDSGAGTPPHANSSPSQSFTITVDAVNDAPSFTLPGAAPAVDEDSGAQTVAGFATAVSAGPADESGQTLTFSVTQSSADPSLTFSVAPSIAADGTLTYTPAPNAYGTATFAVVLTDDGAGTPPNANTSVTRTFTIAVTALNDAPSFTIAAMPPASAEDGGAQSVSGFAGAISPGANESGQTLTFVLSTTASTGTLAFSSGPSIDPATGALTYTAAPNTHGTVTFNAVLTDDGPGTAGQTNTSSPQPFTITVDAVNDAPAFTLPPAAPAVAEDAGAQSVAGFAGAISAGPADESGQTLAFSVTQTSSAPTLTFSAAPSIAANGTLSYTAAPNAYGSATFDVVLTDDGSGTPPNANTSVTRTFTITVTAVDDAPVAANDSYSYPVDGSSLTVAAPGVLANDSDIDSPSLTAVVVSPPSEGTLALAANGSFTYTKAAAPAGTSVSFTYRASDGTGFSAAATVTIALNAPPVAAGDAFSLLEDESYAAAAPGLLANDTDPDNNIAMLELVTGPDCAGYAAGTCGSLTLGLLQDGSFFYQPPADFNGAVTFTYKLIDGGGLESAPATATLTVTPVNDAPSFTTVVVEATGAQNSALITVPYATAILRGPATATDETSQKVHFETEIYLNDHVLEPFADVGAGVVSTTGVDIDSTGTLRFKPSNSTGTARIWVRLVDDGGTDNGGQDTSAVVELLIRITTVFINKAPSFNITNLTVNEDAAAQSVTNWVSSISAGAGESSQTVTMSVDSYTNPGLFSVPPALVSNTRLTYTLAPNAVGSSTLTIKAKDNGGTANGGVDELTKTATITVTAVNDAPSFTKGSDLVYAGGTTGAQSVPGWATAISSGPSDESAQTVSFAVTVQSGSGIFTGTPAIASNGTLSFTLNGTTGLAVLNVRISDNGGTANGGVNQSALQSFTINAGGVNSPPSFVKGADVTVLEDSGAASYSGWATGISPGPAADAAQTVSFNATAANPSLFSTQPAVSPAGVLTFTPALNQSGSTTVSVTAVDNGGTAGGGSNTSAAQTFTIAITAVNDAPTLSIPSPAVSGGENGGPRSIAGFASAAAGPSETGQTPFTYTVTQTSGSLTLFAPANGGVAPAISAAGVLTFTTAVNENGSATFSVTVRDAGGTANGGIDTSTAQSFTITISSGGPSVPPAAIAFNAYANIPITVGSLPGEAAYNLLDGASDPDLPLSVLVTSKAPNARVDVAADGSFTFRNGDLTYAGGATQPQSFRWRVCDSLGNCSAERTATVSFIGPLVFFSDASAATTPGLYTLDVPGKSIPAGFTTNAAPAATYIIKSGTYTMGTTGVTTQLSLRAGDRVYGQGTAGLTLASLGISQASLTAGTLPSLPSYATGTIPTLHMPDPTLTVGGGIVITQSPFFKGYGGGSVKHLRFTRAVDHVASWILFSNASWTSTPGDYVFDDIISVNGQGFAIPQVGSSITVKNSDLTLSEGFGLNGGTITVTNTPIRLTSTDTSTACTLFSDFDSATPGTITATVDAASPITITNNVGHLFPLTISNPSWMPMGTFTIDSDITITRTSTTAGLFLKLMSNVALNGKVTVTTATGKPVDIANVSNLTMPHASNTARMTATPASALNAGITMTNVTAGAAGINLINIDVRKGYLLFDNTNGSPSGPITITGGSVVGDFINPCITTSNAANVTVTGVTTSNCGS